MKFKSKKYIVIIYICLNIILFDFVLLFLGNLYVLADDFEEEIENEEKQIEEVLLEVSGKSIEEPIINSKSAVILDRKTRKVLWGKEENKIRAMASTTKIMTAIIVLENANLEDIVVISKKAANTGGSRLKINTGDRIKVIDLLYGLMLRSGNDAAVALAEHVSGSIENFAYLMNKKAKELGLYNTNFVTPHGLDNDNHFTTAYELAILTDYALSNDIFAKIVNTKSINISINNTKRTIHNTNELLGTLYGVNGVKTGFTGNAGRCLVVSCTRNGNQIITVVLGADTKKQRTKDSISLIEYAFKNYEWINIKEKIKEEFEKWKQINEKRIYINKAKENNINLVLGKIENEIIPLKIENIKDLNIRIDALYCFEAPLDNGVKIGTLAIKNNEEIIEEINIVNSNIVNKKTVYDYFTIMLQKITTGEVLNY